MPCLIDFAGSARNFDMLFPAGVYWSPCGELFRLSRLLYIVASAVNVLCVYVLQHLKVARVPSIKQERILSRAQV